MDAPCPVCRGTGFAVRTADDGVAVAAECACRRERRGERLLETARIPRRYAHCAFDTFEVHHPSQGVALEQSRRWVARWGEPGFKLGLLFLGGPGTGKTHLAVSIARELCAHKETPVLFYEHRELLKELQFSYSSADPQAQHELLSRLWGVDVLVLDDLGAGRITPWVQDVLHDILAQRYNDERPVVLTSNRLTGDEADLPDAERARQDGLTLRDRLGDALMSRIYEMCVIVRMEGKDYRREALNARLHF